MKKKPEKKTALIRSITALLFISSAVLPVWGQSKTTGKSFFWQIDYQSRMSYIMGSIHFLKKNIYPLPELIENAFEKSDFLVVEADISNSKMAENLTLTMRKAMYQGEESLKSNLSPETYELARKILEKMGMDISFYHKFKPWFLAMSLSGMELMKMGFDPNYGLDKYFIDLANEKSAATGKARKEILELEGIGFQIDLFNGFTAAENDRFLYLSLQDITHYRTEMEPMVQAWKQGDVKAMERILKQDMNQSEGMASIYKRLVDDRNHQMTEKIASYLSTRQSYFIVVGAGHLVGDQGIISLLESRGIKINQL